MRIARPDFIIELGDFGIPKKEFEHYEIYFEPIILSV
jgi:hypothetical protein